MGIVPTPALLGLQHAIRADNRHRLGNRLLGAAVGQFSLELVEGLDGGEWTGPILGIGR